MVNVDVYLCIPTGKVPYGGLAGKEILEALKAGYRLEKPGGCTDDM